MAFPTFPPLRLRLAEYYWYAENGGRPIRRTRQDEVSLTTQQRLDKTQSPLHLLKVFNLPGWVHKTTSGRPELASRRLGRNKPIKPLTLRDVYYTGFVSVKSVFYSLCQPLFFFNAAGYLSTKRSLQTSIARSAVCQTVGYIARFSADAE